VGSKADDFDVRSRDPGPAGHGRPPADGGFQGNAADVDYDLGYDAPGWDTQGFRRPEAGYPDSHESGQTSGGRRGGVGTAVRPGEGPGEGPGHSRAASPPVAGPSPAGPLSVAPPPAGPVATAETSQLGWDSEATGLWTPEAPVRGRRAMSGGGPGGPGGPRGPRGPRGFGGPGRRGLERPKVKVKGSWWRHWTLRKALGLVLAVAGGIVVLGAVAVVMAYERTPVPTGALEATGFSQSVVYSKDGTLVGRFGNTNRKMVTYDDLRAAPAIVNAVLAAEDRNFYTEGGISPTGIARAAYEDVTGGDGSLQGGSTITQEFVRQYYSGIGTQQTMSRKIKEIFVAMKVAKEKSKPWILTNYLNTIYFGDGAYGVQAAAQTYYGKTVDKLTVAQAAVIAAIIQQPSNYPLPQYRVPLENRWHYVLNGMVQMGKLTQQQADTMKFPAPGNHIPQTVGKDVWDPYLLDMVRIELMSVYHLSKSQIFNGGYVIRTSIDDTKMAALYRAVRDNEALIDESSVPLKPTYMHVGALLEDPSSGAIEALYPGPGYPGSKYNGTGKVITTHYCDVIHCQVNMAVYNSEQVGSSFKPYVLSAAVKAGMNVQTSTLYGFNNQCIPPDNNPTGYPEPAFFTTAGPLGCHTALYYPVHNDSAAENGPYTPQIAMAVSINTAYADLWHTVGGKAVADMAQEFGVDTNAACITASCGTGKDTIPAMQDEAGVALGQASLTIAEQATMLATIDNGGIYHSAHVITSLAQPAAPAIPIKVTSYPVFNSNPVLNQNMATQVQYAMSEDDASYGTAPVSAMSNGQEIIAKTGTTNTAQSAFFIGAVPSQALAVAIFTNEQGEGKQSLDGLGGNSQGGEGGTWPATIWHTYAEDQFVPLGIEPFPAPVFTGATWNQVPPGLRKVAKKHKKPNHNNNGNPGGGNGGGQGGNGGGNPNPYPTYSCDPTVVTCTPGDGAQNAEATTPATVPAATPAAVPAATPAAVPAATPAAGPAGAAGAVVIGLPATCLWVRRRQRKRTPGRG
jgi:membrane peptidoglycan carboxypeptidase